MKKIYIIRLQKIIKIILLTFVLVCCYIIFSTTVFGLSAQIGGYQLLTVLSGSMEPDIQAGSIIVVKRMNDPNTLEVNDIITFQSPRMNDQFVTHRIVEVTTLHSNTYFSTKGDANSTTDAERIDTNHIIGKYQNITIPYLGLLLEMTKTKIGFILFVLFPIILLVKTYVGSFGLSQTIRSKSIGGGNNES